ncbi:MAG: hypothetical protein ACI9LV_000859 [Candidatus Nanohaloarchaea archaeon]|jgi:hypothetical protein
MAIKRKGFVYTLEAVIASTIILSMILFVIPEISPDPEIELAPLQSGIETLDDQGKLNSSTSNLTESVRPYKPGNYNLTTQTTTLGARYETVSGDQSFQVSSGSKDLLLWIDNADDLEVTFGGVNVLETDESGYREVSLGSEPGYLNFTGNSIDLDLQISNYSSEGEIPEANTVRSVNYIDMGKKLREIQVIMWR